jgi:hypothetical protein
VSGIRITDEFKRDAVAQVADGGIRSRKFQKKRSQPMAHTDWDLPGAVTIGSGDQCVVHNFQIVGERYVVEVDAIRKRVLSGDARRKIDCLVADVIQ